eukprot:4066017-Alexandrium_andersonii.AAC.1
MCEHGPNADAKTSGRHPQGWQHGTTVCELSVSGTKHALTTHGTSGRTLTPCAGGGERLSR